MAVLLFLLLIVDAVDGTQPPAHSVSIKGLVQDTSCYPIPGARVWGSFPVGETVTDKEGRFELHVPPTVESVQVFASIVGFRTSVRGGVPLTAAQREHLLTVDVGALTHIDPVLPLGQSPAPAAAPTALGLRGEILTARCQPLAHAEVHLVSPDGSALRTTSDRQGRFTFDTALPGVYLLEVDAPGFIHVHRSNTKVGPDGPPSIRVLMDDAANGVVDISIDK